MNEKEIIMKWVLFGYNFEQDFIEKAFEGQGEWLIKHLKKKWERILDNVGSYGALNYFFCELDGNNKQILVDYVMKNSSI